MPGKIHAVASKKSDAKPAALRPRVRALLEIRRLQRSAKPTIRHAPFCHVVLKIAMEFRPGLLWQPAALDALHEESEGYLVKLFQDTILLAIYAKPVTITPKNMYLACPIRREIL